MQRFAPAHPTTALKLSLHVCICSSDNNVQVTYQLLKSEACFLHLTLFFCRRVSSPQKDELDDIPIELSKVQSVKVRSRSETDHTHNSTNGLDNI